jgi:hypothetical protein
VQDPGSFRLGFGGSLLPPLVDASFFGQRNPRSLPLLDVLVFDFGYAKEQRGNQMP